MALDDYKNKLPAGTSTGNTSNNFNRPPISVSNGNTTMQGWRGAANPINVFSNAPAINWNTQYTKWSLNGSTSSSVDTAQKIANVASIFGLGITTITAGLGIYGTIKALKSAKNGDASSDEADTQSLDNLTNEASNYADGSKKGNLDKYTSTSNSLNKQIQGTTETRNTLSRALESKRTTKSQKETALQNKEAALEKFKSGKQELTNTITVDEQELTQLKNSPDADTDVIKARIAELEEAISQNKAKLESEYSDEKLNTLNTEISNLERDITTLGTEIKTGEGSLATYDKKIQDGNAAFLKLHAKIVKEENGKTQA